MKYYPKILKTVISYLNTYPAYWFWMGVRVVYVIIEVLIPILLGYIINLYTAGEPLEIIIRWSLLLIGLFLVTPMLEVFTSYKAWSIAVRAGYDFRYHTVQMLKHTGLAFWQDKNKGSILKIIDQGTHDFFMLAASLSHTYVWWGGRVVGIFIASTFIDPVIFLIYSVDLILFCLNLRLMVPIETKQGLEENKGQENVTGKINEYIHNFRTIVYLNLFKAQEKNVKTYNDTAYDLYYKREVTSSWKWYFNGQLHSITQIAILCYGLYQVLQGNFEIGTLTTIMFFSMRFSDDLSALVYQSEEFVRYMNGLTRYYETFDTVKIADDQLVPTEDITFQNLSFDNVSLQRKERETLQNVSFDLPKGQKLAIVGYTGSGKSTMIDIILKAITDFQGDVHLNDRSYKDLKVIDITNIFSVVPQEVQLFRDTVKGNILASNPDFSGSLDTLISTCMLGDLINKLPKGVDTEISEGSTNISGGERQRIGIARALVEQQPILVLDEATASLDPKTERQVITNIIHSYPDLTVIYITHKYSLLNYFDHILVLSDGKIIEQGDFNSLVKRGGLFKDLFEASQI